ncbi:MAG: phage minor head protein [Anaerovoracaceae bacterium]
MIEDEDISKEDLENWSKDYSSFVSETLEPMWLEAIVAGQLSNAILDEIRGKEFEFDATDEGIRNWIKDRGSEFVTNAVQEQKKAIQRLTMKAVREELSPNELARVIRPCIGLTERQAQANLKYYSHIKEQLRKDHPRMKEENIVRRARDRALKYAEKQHRYRAETIAQTELAEAYNAGAHQGIKQAQERGYIGHVKKVWVTARQDNVCKYCEAVEGVSKEMDEYFDVGKCGRVLIPPAHPRCRCVVKYVEVEE